MKKSIASRNDVKKRYADNVYKRFRCRWETFNFVLIIISFNYRQGTEIIATVGELLNPEFGGILRDIQDISDEEMIIDDNSSEASVNSVVTGKPSPSIRNSVVTGKPSSSISEVVEASVYTCPNKKCKAFGKDFKGPGKLAAHKRCSGVREILLYLTSFTI